MNFILRMAARELRSGWRRLTFFFLCIGLGVGAIVALRSTVRNANVAVAAEARQLLTADVQLDSSREWAADELQTISRLAPSFRVARRTETLELQTMLRPADDAKVGALLVELKGVEPNFPLYGDFTLSDGTAFDPQLLADNGTIVARALLERLSLRVGEQVKLGESTFQIRATFDAEPGAGTGCRLGPRVFVARDRIAATGLINFGSRARRRVLLATASSAEIEPLVRELRAALKGKLIGVRSYKDAQEGLSEQFARAENYLSLTGLVILVLGGIGIANVTRVFVEQKRQAIAILKCIGARSWQVTATYLTQVLTLGLLGSLFGVALAKGALVFVHARFAESLPARMDYSLQPSAAWQGIGLGLLISLLFSALPLLRVRRIKPNLLLRAEGQGSATDALKDRRRSLFKRLTFNRDDVRKFDWVRLMTGLCVIAGLVLTAGWQAGSWRVGMFFLAGFAVASGALYAASIALLSAVKGLRGTRTPFALRYAAGALSRPGNQTRVIVLSVGLGVFLILAVLSLQANLLREFDPMQRAQLPNLYLIDIQTDQRAGVEELIKQATNETPRLVPTVRTRLAQINGRDIDLEARQNRQERGMLGREYVVTYRPTLEGNEEIVAGKFWSPTPAGEPEVSIEEGLRGLAGLDLGGTITFDVLGRRLTARVTSVRRVDWRNSRTGFLILFRPGALEDAPQSLIAPVSGATDASVRARLQRAVADKYPNVSAIDVTEIVGTLTRILNNVTLAVAFLGGFVLLSGALILVGSVALSKWQRTYEAAVLKTLGARRQTLIYILLAEYGLLGAVAGLVGALAATGLSYAVARYVFEIDWRFSPTLNLLGVVATALVVASIGVLSSFDVLARKPLNVLRRA